MAKQKPARKPPTLDLDECITLPEAAAIADVSDRHMRTLVERGLVTGKKLGRNYLVSAASARAFQRSQTMGRPRGKA
jgi:hypothetical protein